MIVWFKHSCASCNSFQLPVFACLQSGQLIASWQHRSAMFLTFHKWTLANKTHDHKTPCQGTAQQLRTSWCASWQVFIDCWHCLSDLIPNVLNYFCVHDWGMHHRLQTFLCPLFDPRFLSHKQDTMIDWLFMCSPYASALQCQLAQLLHPHLGFHAFAWRLPADWPPGPEKSALFATWPALMKLCPLCKTALSFEVQPLQTLPQ